MNSISVIGLWHLGSVTAAYVANLGMQVVAYDPDPNVVHGLQKGQAPLLEPGLNELLAKGLASGRLHFTCQPAEAVRNCSIVWITFDTPVDKNDKADIQFIKTQLQPILKSIEPGTSLIVSSQLPVGFCRQLERSIKRSRPKDNLAVCYSPENLRLGKALDVMANPDRIIVGLGNLRDRARYEPLFSKLSSHIKWMSIESAEMTKHALNAFLATSVVFANEIATVCEAVGANARDVADGLLSESRIGPKAYLHPGAAFAGGTLARDVQFLIAQGRRYRLALPQINGTLRSNQQHHDWVKAKIKDHLIPLRKKTIALLGLTYKPGTDTLRRSWAIELAEWLHKQGASVQAFDPHISALPSLLRRRMALKSGIRETLQDADCAVIVTNHEVFRNLAIPEISQMRSPWVIDPNGILFSRLGLGQQGVNYITVGFQSKGMANENGPF